MRLIKEGSVYWITVHRFELSFILVSQSVRNRSHHDRGRMVLRGQDAEGWRSLIQPHPLHHHHLILHTLLAPVRSLRKVARAQVHEPRPMGSLPERLPRHEAPV